MSDDSSAAIRDTRKDWSTEHREMYLKSGGAEGHIMDITAVGGPRLGTHLLLKYTGRKSGKVFITPLCYGVVGGEVVIVASKGGADQHPEWYLNLIAAGEVDFQIATQAFHAILRVPDGTEHDKVWAHMAEFYPFYTNYQAATARRIPLVLLKAIDIVPVFTESEATGMRQL